MLSIVATPIGNLGDMSARGVQALRGADVIACEDTRRTRILLERYEVPMPRQLISYREGNEERVGGQIAGYLGEGKNVALCSDGGCPGISDPGYRLVRLAVERGLAFEVIPGASAVHTALLLSGLATSSYTFKGYPPRKPGALRRFFETEKEGPHTLVVFESPFRVGATLQAAAEVLGERAAAVCVEMTTTFERVSRGTLGELAAGFRDQKIKGEVTLVMAGRTRKEARDAEGADGVE